MKSRIYETCGTYGTMILASAMMLSAGTMFAAQSDSGAKQDMKNAGTETKDAAKDAGHGVKQGTKKAYHKTKHGTKKAWHSTKHGTHKAAEKVEDKTADKPQ